MANGYDATSFEPNYCEEDLTKITQIIKAKASLLVIGMPGCGKSRLIDFLLQKPDILEKYDLSNNYEFIRVDGDAVTQPHDMYIRLWRALDPKIKARPEGGIHTVKYSLLAEVENLEADIDVVVIFDNFNRRLQRALGEDFFNFLFALRNARSKLNVSYIFMANLKIDLAGFYKVDRLFDKGVDRSICWLSLLNWQDASFSIERQWRKVEDLADKFSEAEREKIKKKIYKLGGGHALLGRYLAHLMLSDEVTVASEPSDILKHHGIRSACESIWEDLEQNHKNLLIDVANGQPIPVQRSQPFEILRNYSVLKEQAFFSPIFECFVKEQEKSAEVISAGCDEDKIRIIIQTIDDRQMLFTLDQLTPKKRTLFCYLAENLGETCTREQLIEAGWPSDDASEPKIFYQALSRHMDDLRKWLRNRPQLNQYLEIKNVWGEGYKLVITN